MTKQLNNTTSTFNRELNRNIRDTVKQMVEEGRQTGKPEITRKGLMQSDEQARLVICRLEPRFQRIDCVRFRSAIIQLQRKKADNGGMPHFVGTRTHDPESMAMSRINLWEKTRERNHSQEYLTYLDSDLWRDRCAEWKRKKGFQCAACGDFQIAERLEIHHYTYDRLKNERDDDVCCVCSRSTGRRCHQLMDFARLVKNRKWTDDELRGLFRGVALD